MLGSSHSIHLTRPSQFAGSPLFIPCKKAILFSIAFFSQLSDEMKTKMKNHKLNALAVSYIFEQ